MTPSSLPHLGKHIHLMNLPSSPSSAYVVYEWPLECWWAKETTEPWTYYILIFYHPILNIRLEWYIIDGPKNHYSHKLLILPFYIRLEYHISNIVCCAQALTLMQISKFGALEAEKFKKLFDLLRVFYE